jgi:hypothetical protein
MPSKVEELRVLLDVYDRAFKERHEGEEARMAVDEAREAVIEATARLPKGDTA